MKDQGIARSDKVKKNIEGLGGKLLDAYYCLGEYDVVAILEFPDNKTAMKAAVRNASLGHISITTIAGGDTGRMGQALTRGLGKEIRADRAQHMA